MIEQSKRFSEAFEALQESKRRVLAGGHVSHARVLDMLAGWLHGPCAGDESLAAAVLDVERRLVRLRLSEAGTPLADERNLEPFEDLGSWLQKLAREAPASGLPGSIESAADAIAWAEHYLALTARPEDIEPWHRHFAAMSILSGLFGVNDGAALASGFERVARAFDEQAIVRPGEGAERANAAYLYLKHVEEVGLEPYFEGIAWPAQDESYFQRRSEAAAVLHSAFELERDSGWTERVDWIMVV